MNRAYIQALDLEFIQKIISHATRKWDGSLSKNSLSQLRLVSWQFRDAADPLLFSEIKFDFNKRPLGLVVQQLDDMARNQSELLHCVKKLIIESTEIPISGSITRMTYVGLLPLALRSLLELRSIHWTISRVDDFSIIVDSITNLPHLEHLFLDFSAIPARLQTSNMITLHRFTQLRSFGFRAEYPADPLATSIIQQLRINSIKETLTSLAIDFTGHTKNKEIFHEIVSNVPNRTPLQLKHLQAHGWKLVLHPGTVSHLRCLSSLDISRMDMESHAKVWSDLQAVGIQLRKIAGPLSISLVMYLRSYAGLEHLTIAITSRGSNIFHDLCQSLPFHKETLKFFDGSSERCTPNDMMAIQTCEKLDYLVVQLGRSSGDFENALATALELPHLRIFNINYRNAIDEAMGGPSRLRDRSEHIILDVLSKLGHRIGPTPVVVFANRVYSPNGVVEDIKGSG